MKKTLPSEIVPINIEDELKQSYLDYAMSVIVGRALPDVRDGLKPVHRRVLYAMKVLSNDYNKAYKKSARVVGDVIGKYHPHGDSAVYDTMVRMAQPFSLRYMLIDGQGNFGSIDGDSPAAMRYTEVRMSKIAQHLLLDIDKETVNFAYNYDNTEMIPEVLPTRIPNLLINGSSGIAVGMATNIPPHNLNEVINAMIALIKDENLSIEDLMSYIPAPDFPTGAYINGTSGIQEAYKSGKGRMIIRSKACIKKDGKSDREQIIVTELPFQINKARLIKNIVELVKDKKLEGISEIRDESDKDGLRIVINVKRGEKSEVLLNNLYAQTQMEITFCFNMVVLVDNKPKLLNLKEIIQYFIAHRKEIITRRTIFELNKSREKAHILEGFALALSNINSIVDIIKLSKNIKEAKEKLLNYSDHDISILNMLNNIDKESDPIKCFKKNNKYLFTKKQVEAILDLRLHRLSGLEKNKIFHQFKKEIIYIKELIHILNDKNKLMNIICEELKEIQRTFGDKRKSEIITSKVNVGYEDLINKELMVVTLSYDGYVKTQPLKDYNIQKRGGRGKSSMQIKSEDFVYKLTISSTHHTMLCFSSSGKIYWKKVYEFPQYGRSSRGKPINNIFPLDRNERITAMLSIEQYNVNFYVFMSTKNGIVKKVDLSNFSRPRKGGIYALNLDDNDELLHVNITDGTKEIMMFSNCGKAIRFDEKEVRSMSRVARGVRGMRLQKNDFIVGVIVTQPDHGLVLTATKNGYGKRTLVSEFRKTSRGSQGVRSISTSERNGLVVSATLVKINDDIMLMTDQGQLVRIHVSEIRETGRSAQGVRLINLKKEKLASIQVVNQ